MAGATIAPSLPGLQDQFTSVEGAEAIVPLILTVPGLAIAVTAPLAGILADRFPKRRILLVSICLYVLAGSSGLYLQTLDQLLVGRVLLGVAVGGLMTSTVSLLASLYSHEERGRILGFQAAAMSFGGVAFILAGGFLADMSWRGPFAIYLAPIALLPAVLAFAPPGRPEPEARMKGTKSHAFPYAWSAVIYMGLFTSFLIFYTIPLKLPFLLRDLGMDSATTAGSAIALLTLAAGATSMGYGRIRTFSPPGIIAAVFFAIMGLAFAYLSTVPPVPMIFATMVLIGVACGVIYPNATTWLYSRIPPDRRGRAAGYTTMSVFTAQFLSAPVTAWLAPIGGFPLIYGSASGFALSVAFFYGARHLRKRKTRAYSV